MQFAHAGDDGLGRVRVGADPEGRVLLGQGLQGPGHLVLVGLGARLHRHVDHRVGVVEALQDDGAGRVAQGVAGAAVLDADRGGDVAGADAVEVDPVVGVHLEYAAHPLLGPGAGVEHLAALAEGAAVDPEIGELADVGVGHDLEGQRGEGLGVAGPAGDLVPRLGVAPGDGGHVQRRGQVVDHRVQQRLHPLVLEGGAVEDRHQLAGHGGPADGRLDLGLGDLGLVEELLEDPLVVVRELLEQIVAVQLGLVGHLGGHLGGGPGGAQVVAAPGHGLHRRQVDHPPVAGLGPDGQLDGHGVGGEALDDRVEHVVEVGAGAVHLVDEAHAGHAVAVGLAPHRLGLGLHPGHPVEDGHRPVEDPQRALDLDGEVDVAGGVDDVDAVVVPDAVGGRGGDGDAPLLLLVHPVHGGGPVVDLADLVVAARVVEDPLGGGGLARVDVGHDPDVARPLERITVVSHLCRSSNARGAAGPGRGRPRRPRGRRGPAAAAAPTSGSGRTPCSTRPSSGDPRGA